MPGILIVVLVAALLLLDLLAWFKAADSRDPVDSDEWELRRLWRSMR
jgi:hypothetical protein